MWKNILKHTESINILTLNGIRRYYKLIGTLYNSSTAYITNYVKCVFRRKLLRIKLEKLKGIPTEISQATTKI
jgi:hypothetical protein